ncbi:MAG: YdeI/OmpD-associated family protein [Pseudoxanthomonas suwonensis]|nr:YdeI/OmpD-associated family protein [Pseudoxanthomonas suwonensis]
MTRDPRVDAYIAGAAEFAQPLLAELRERVHRNCPDVVEAIKWGMPAFLHGGAIFCTMAAFKQHVSFGYWRHAEVMGADVERDGMGSYGRMATVKDLPGKRGMQADLRKALALADTAPARAAGQHRPQGAAAPAVPAELAAALQGNAKARAAFDSFPPSARRDYIEWITEAKREDTRARRLAQTIQWLAEGKRRNWKYEARKPG